MKIHLLKVGTFSLATYLLVSNDGYQGIASKKVFNFFLYFQFQAGYRSNNRSPKPALLQ